MAASGYRQLISRKGFNAFLWTQFLGAFNDNFYRMVVSLVAVEAASGTAGRNLSLVGAIFIAPFLLFSGYAGQLADIYSKRTVLIVTKSLEILTAALGVAAFLAGRLELTLAVLFLFALQATFFSPAKYGILPEVLPDRDLSRANGLLEMSTFVAIVAGTAIGSYVFGVSRGQLWITGLAVLAIAIIGTATSFGIAETPAAAPGAPFRLNPWAEVWDGLRRLRGDRVLWLTVIGISYFWFLGSLLQLAMVLFGTEMLRLDDRWVGLLTACAAIGIGAGSLTAGRLSGDKVELGLAPLGAIGMGVFAILLSRSTTSVVAAGFTLTAVGFFGGWFAVPLNAMLQQRSGEQERGRLLATNNFLNMVGVALASGALWLCTGWLRMPADRIFLTFGILTLVSSAYVLWLVPEFTIRFSLWLLTHTAYRIRILGQENVPARGPALLVCNHVSFVDGFLVTACVQRFIRFMVYKPYYERASVHWLMELMKVIPVGSSRREIVASLASAREQLEQGHVVCIFAEGSITRTGNLLPFKRGFERIVEGLDVPVIPVYLDRVWGSIFSFKGGRFFWKWPLRVPYPVTVAFGERLSSSTSAAEARLAMLELGCEVAIERYPVNENLGRQFIRTAKRRWRSFCMADSTGQQLTFGRALVASLLLAGWIRRHAGNETHVGLLLPASVGGALANVATTLAGKVSVNLNFTTGHDGMMAAASRCQIKTILTSRAFVAKASITPIDGMVFLEDILRQTTRGARLRTLIAAYLLPAGLLARLYASVGGTADDVATVIFSSGSTGIPKGVMLSHRNILANVDAIWQVFDLTTKDVIVGVLPFFHSFGFTVTIWFPLTLGFGVAYHPNPMDAKTVGELAQKFHGTFLIATPTFCVAYTRKCQPEQFSHLRYVIVGAEKLRDPVAQAFREKFGIPPLEGYGCTELAPVVAVNTPDVTDGGISQRGTKPGSVGQPVPGVVAKVIDPDTGTGPLFGKEGLLLVKGANRMVGYLNEPERTLEVLRDGWYVTGDVAVMDDDGFIFMTDRLSRFAKIGGEMVPFMKIESSINALIGDHASVVTSVPDESRGERLVAFYTDPALQPGELWERLCRTDLPRLWIPKREDLHYIEALPTLGSGKVDLRMVRQLAAGEVSQSGAAVS
jgi:acyl-[acyl-carrier-protein]-phospholipid O-acyltransferase/long-chain-fatty-acid--[acyl-carrier-protein] ligase